MSSKSKTLALMSLFTILASSSDENLLEDCLPKSKSKSKSRPQMSGSDSDPEPDQKDPDWANWYQRRREENLRRREENSLVEKARDMDLLARAEIRHVKKPTAKTVKRITSLRRKLKLPADS